MMLNQLLDKKNQVAIAILMVVPMVILYRMIFFGEIVGANDQLERHPINQWRNTYVENNSEFPQWFPNLFSGMPSYGGYIYTPGDPTRPLQDLIFFNKGIKIWFYLVLGSLGMFFFLRSLGVGSFGSIIGGLLTGLTPYGFGLINAGHLNKIFAMAFIPWILMFVFDLMKKSTIKSILLVSMASAFQLWANHPQIVYYTWMVIGFYFVWELGSSVKEKSFSAKTSGTQLGGIIVALVIALFMVSDPYVDIYKFQKHSNRGAKSVLDQTGQTETGTDWRYATQWSFHPKETISFVFPYHYGLQNYSTRDLKSAAYWGFMPFTQSTHYLGLIAIILAILGALLRKPDKTEWFFWIATLLALTTGFGSFFPVLFEPFYSILPFFSKFRIPSMIYILLAVTVPILAARGIDSFMQSTEKKDTLKKCIYVAGGIAGLSVLFLLIGESFFDFSNPKDSRFNPAALTQLKTIRIELLQKGLLLALAVSLASLGLMWGYIEEKLNKQIFCFAIIGLVIVDLSVVNMEFLNLKPAQKMDRFFQETKIVKHLQNDSSHFRIFPADELNSNKYSYWNLESIGGYRPIKLRNYQDLMDAKGFSRPHILNMLNVKYVLTTKKINNPYFVLISNLNGIYENQKVLPKAWLVGKIKTVKTQRESLMETMLNGFNPSQSAIVVDFPDSIALPENAAGKVDILSRKENRIELLSQSETGGLLVLSEIYYKPGWKAFVNGEDAPIYQTNHVLRSVYVPKGDVTVIYKYDDSLWTKTRILSRVSFIVVLFGIGFLFWKEKNEY